MPGPAISHPIYIGFQRKIKTTKLNKQNKSYKRATPKTLIKSSVRKPRTSLEVSALSEFENIEYLHPSVTEALDKNRNDLREAIHKTLRIQQAFLRRLTREAPLSNRIKHTIRLVEEISVYCDFQRDILEQKISKVLTYRPSPKEH